MFESYWGRQQFYLTSKNFRTRTSIVFHYISKHIIKNTTCITNSMSTQTLYCASCKKNYNVRNEDLELMKEYHKSFDGKEYVNGCFFKELTNLKRTMKIKEYNETLVDLECTK